MPRVGKYDKELDWLCPDPLVYNLWESHASYHIIQKYRTILNWRVADFGCNNAIQCCMLSNSPSVDSVIGFDISENALNDARRNIRNHAKCRPEKIEFWQCNLVNNDYPDCDIDAGICLHTLEHIYPEDLNAVVSGMRRIMRPGARLVFSVPCRDAFSQATRHVSQFSIQPEDGYISLVRLFKDNGFSIWDIYEDDLIAGDNTLCITGVACTP